ncbi:MAG TPA: N-6 DNA methylase [Candidatus Kapabacteria bacterium]|nr:N-6 DNA methylase [Candidatus Kapabacteria bacterium]
MELGLPDVETISTDRKMPDLVIYESPRSKQVLCVMEAKLPCYDAFDETSLKNSARQKATNRKARYFALTNFKQLVWFNTESVNAMKPEEELIIGSFELSSIENLEDIESTSFKNAIKEGLEDFLSRLYNVHTGNEAEPKLPIDELLISRIHEKIRILAFYYKDIIRDKCHKQSEFAAHKRLADLDPLEIPVSLTRGALLQNHLQGYFAEVLKIDYKTIYTTDFIDEIAYLEDKRVITEIKKLIDILRRYDFSILGYDIIGRIFEQLIPMDERHNLGQYFTNADIVDLILKFSSHHEDETILDPSCGAGTFLVRAYQHKKMMISIF